jgi:hypothetical protein
MSEHKMSEHQMIKDIYNYFEQKIPPNSIDNILQLAIKKVIA